MLRIVVALLIAQIAALGADATVERAWQLAASGKREAAISLLQQTLRSQANNADARLLLGSLLSEAGRKKEAVEELNAAVRLRPHSAEAQNALGEAYTGLGDTQQALRCFQLAVADNPGFAVAQLNLGRALLQSEQFKAAAPHLDRALSGLPNGPDAAVAHYLRAKSYSAANDFAAAAQELQKAVGINDAFPEAWSDLGMARASLGEHAQALAALRRAVELAPDDPVAEYRLGQEYLAAHQPAPAVEALQRADRASPTDQSILNALLKALRQTGQIEQADAAKARLEKLLDDRQTNAQRELKAAELNDEGAQLQQAGDLNGALQKYSEAVKLSPRNVTMHVNYAVAMLRLGEWTQGLNALHESLLLDPENSKIKAALRDALAQAPAGSVPHWTDGN